MANTYALISSNTLSSSQASVTFSSIPSTYTDLVLKCSNRTASGGVEDLLIEFNNDSSTIYSSTRIVGNGSTATSSLQSGVTLMNAYESNWNSDTANTFSNGEFYIPNYTSTSNKPISIYGAREVNATAGTLTARAGLYRNTSAITSIKLTYSGGNSHLTGSSFFLYGIKNS